MNTVQELLESYGVRTYKETSEGLVAIHKKIKGEWFWLYFRFNGVEYCLSGSSRFYED